jgi:mRNA interferase MazF
LFYLKARDVTVVFVSSRITKATSNDVLIKRVHPEFEQTGLKVDSFLKIEKIATLSKKLVLGELGVAGPMLKKEINSKVAKTLKL